MGSLIFSRRARADGQANGKGNGTGGGSEQASMQDSERGDEQCNGQGGDDWLLRGECLDAWGVAALGGGGMNEQSDEYDSFVSSALECDGCVADVETYELGDVSIHLTSCFHRTGPNLAGTPRRILAATYFADGATARCDVDVANMTQGQRNDWKKFAPGVAPGDPVTTWLNPLLAHADTPLAHCPPNV